MNKGVGFRWYSGEEEEEEEEEEEDGDNNRLHQVGVGGGDHHQALQPPSASSTTTNSDVFGFWTNIIQQQEQQQQQQQKEEHLPTQTDAVVTTAEGSSQASGQRHKKKAIRSTPHNVSEKRRRDRFNEKIRTLKELLPDCHKKDPISVLDKTIKEIQLLKIQAQEQYMASTIRVPPTHTNVVGMVNYPPMQLLQYPNISPMPMPMPMPILPFLPLGHTTITSSIATTEPGGGLLGFAQLQEGGCSGDGAGSSAGGSAKDAQGSRSTDRSS